MGWRPGAAARARTTLRFLACALACAWATGSIRARPRLRRRDLPGILRARHRHLRSLGEAGKAGGDDALACLQASGDHRLHVVLLRQRHAPHGDGVALFEHVHEWPIGTALDGGGRHHDHLPQSIDEHPHVDELAGPKLKIVVGKLGPELHRTRGLVNLIVDHRHLALVERALAVGGQGVDRQLAFGHAFGEIRQVLLGQAEENRDRPELREDDDAGGLRAAHEIAHIDQTDAGTAGDRCDDLGVGQDGAGVVDRRLVELDLRLELTDQRPLGVELLLVDGVGRRQAGVAVQIEPGIGKLRFVLGLLGDGLVECGLVGRGIDLGEHISRGHVLPFRERYVDDFAVDLRAHRHGVERFRGAHAVEIDRNIGRTRGSGEHGNGFARGRAAAAAARHRRHRLLPLRHVVDGSDGGDDEAGNEENGDSSFERHCTTFTPAATPGGNQPPPRA
jgi:hypothetical protein